MKKNYLLALMAFAVFSCTKTDEIHENQADATAFSRQFERLQTEPHSLVLKSKQLAYVKDPVLNDLLREEAEYPRHRQFSIETIFSIDNYYEGGKRFILSYFNEDEQKGIKLFLDYSKLYFTYNNHDYLISAEISRERCYQVSIARNEDGKFFFYLDGVLMDTAVDVASFHGNSDLPLLIGAGGFYSNAANTPVIYIDEIRFWKYYRHQEEINHYLFTNIIDIDYLLGYYNFNNRPSRYIYDFSMYTREGRLIYGAGPNSYVHELSCMRYY